MQVLPSPSKSVEDNEQKNEEAGNNEPAYKNSKQEFSPQLRSPQQNKIHNMKIDRSKIGKQNKRKGALAETKSAKFWSEILNSKIVRTPRSGGFWDWPGDIFSMDDSILKNWIIEIKKGKQIPKKIIDWMEKLKDEAKEKSSFLEFSKSFGEHYVILTRKDFAKLLQELAGWREENRD